MLCSRSFFCRLMPSCLKTHFCLRHSAVSATLEQEAGEERTALCTSLLITSHGPLVLPSSCTKVFSFIHSPTVPENFCSLIRQTFNISPPVSLRANLSLTEIVENSWERNLHSFLNMVFSVFFPSYHSTKIVFVKVSKRHPSKCNGYFSVSS